MQQHLLHSRERQQHGYKNIIYFFSFPSITPDVLIGRVRRRVRDDRDVHSQGLFCETSMPFCFVLLSWHWRARNFSRNTQGSTKKCHPADIWRSSGIYCQKNKDWFNEKNQDIQELLTKKRLSHEAHPAQPLCPVRRAAFRLICSILQSKFRETQNEWWTNLVKRTQQYADLGDYRGFYKALKAVHGMTHWVQSSLHSAGGQVLFTDKASILSRRSEHSQSLFSADRIVLDPAVLCIPWQPFKAELDKLPSMKEITKP